MKPPKTRNSYASCVNRIMKEPELRLKNKLERQGLDWREIDKQINELVRKRGREMIPTHQTTKSAGADLYASETVTIEPQQVRLVGTGFGLTDLPYQADQDLVFMLCNRSSIAYKKALMVCNGVGVIDQDYTDEIKVMYINMSGETQTINKGERIAQLVPMRYVSGLFDVKNNDRQGGFGSTNEQ